MKCGSGEIEEKKGRGESEKGRVDTDFFMACIPLKTAEDQCVPQGTAWRRLAHTSGASAEGGQLGCLPCSHSSPAECHP